MERLQCTSTSPTHQRFLPIHHYYLPPNHCLLQIEERTESDKYKQWDGCVEGNYLPEPLACCQREDIHLFCTESDSRARRLGREGRVSEREGTRREESVSRSQAASKRQRLGMGEGQTKPQHRKVLNL